MGGAVRAEELEGLRGRLGSFCYQMLGSPFDAEDAVQDVLERAWRACESYDETRSSLTTWCFRIARNICIDRLREIGRRPLPRDLQESVIDVGAPLVPALGVPWRLPAPAGWSGGSVPEELADQGLVEECRLLIFPTVLGAARGLFRGRRELTLVSAAQVDPAVLAVLAPEPEHRS